MGHHLCRGRVSEEAMKQSAARLVFKQDAFRLGLFQSDSPWAQSWVKFFEDQWRLGYLSVARGVCVCVSDNSNTTVVRCDRGHVRRALYFLVAATGSVRAGLAEQHVCHLGLRYVYTVTCELSLK